MGFDSEKYDSMKEQASREVAGIECERSEDDPLLLDWPRDIEDRQDRANEIRDTLKKMQDEVQRLENERLEIMEPVNRVTALFHDRIHLWMFWMVYSEDDRVSRTHNKYNSFSQFKKVFPAQAAELEAQGKTR